MSFWKVNNLSGDESELIFYGEIRDSKPWWDDGNFITTEQFLEDIKNLKQKKKLNIRINSGGGDVFAATAIYTQLKNLKAFKTIIIDGICASAATIIAMSGDKVIIPANGFMMIHNPSVMVWDSFQAKDLEQLKNSLEVCKNAIIESYKTKTKLSDDELSELMDNETWFTGREAVERGFADEIMFETVDFRNSGNFTFVNGIKFELDRFANIPKFQTNSDFKPENNKQEWSAEMTIEEIKSKYPELYNQIFNDGALNERNRLMEIDEISNIIEPGLLKRAKYETPINAQQLAFENVKQEAQKGKTFMNSLREDYQASNEEDIFPQGETESEMSDSKKEQKITEPLPAGSR